MAAPAPSAAPPRLPALALLVLLALLGACGEPGAPRPERVLLLVIDATHASHLSCYGGPPGLTPQLDALAARGTRFAHAVSNTTWTLPSTTSLLTGQLQETHGVVTNGHLVDERHELLPELFAEAGYKTAAFVEMIYASAVHGLDQGFDEPNYYSITAGAHPDSLFADLRDWVDAHADERWFAYVHLRRPHSPYDPSRLGLARAAPGAPPGSHPQDALFAQADSKLNEPLPEEQRQRVEQLYRGNLATVDDQLADVLRRAAADPGLLVLLTSDHGEALGEHGHFGHGYQLHAECVDIPLLLAGPGVPLAVDEAPACTVDVAPTLIELCGLPQPGGPLDGRSLVPRLRGEADPRERPLALSARYNLGRVPAQAVLLGRHKLVLHADDRHALYDLDADPHETRDVAAERPELTRQLLELARARRQLGAGLAEQDRVEIPVHEAELRALGYLR